jgi:hypothetical protein
MIYIIKLKEFKMIKSYNNEIIIIKIIINLNIFYNKNIFSIT